MSIPAFAVVKGIEVGLQYGLLAMGLVLIYRCTRILNLAHGQLGVTSAVLLVHLNVDEHVPYGVALPIVLLAAAAIGAGSEIVLRRLKDRPRLLVLVATIGLAEVLRLFALLPFVRPNRLFVIYPLPFHLTFHVGTYTFGPPDVFSFVMAPAVAIAVAIYFSLSKTGLRLRAVADNPESARLAGVPIKRVTMLAWVIAALLSAATAILASPGQGTAFTQALGPDLLFRALTAALIAGMTSLTVAFVAGIGIGVVQQILFQNWIATPTRVDLVMFLLALFALMLRVRRLRQVTASDERSDWRLAVNTARSLDRLRRVVGRSGIAAALAVAVLLPPLLNQSHALLMSQVLVFALIAVSLTILAGWSGQLSLGQLAFVAVGLVVYTRLSDSMSLLLLFLVAGAISAVVAVVIGIPALRIPGLYLAVSTLGLALLMNVAVLPANCFDVGFRFCPGLPDPAGTYTKRPHLFGLSLANEHTVTYVVLGVLCVVLLAAVAWRDRGLARLLLAVRGNELAAAAMGVRPIRTKLIAFAVSGFLAGVAGVCFGLVNQRTSVDSFQASLSYDVVAMVVVGGLGSLSGAVLGAVYLIGLPAIFGSTPTVQVLVSGVGLLGFLLFMPGGVSTALSSAADAITGLVRRAGLWRAPDAAAVPADELAEPVGAGR